MIVLVDDDGTFRSALAESLRDDGYPVLDFATPAEVPPFADLDEVGVLVTDYQLDGEDGLAFADRFHRARPRTAALMLTAFWSERLAAEVEARDFLYFLCKPIDYRVLRDIIDELSRAPAVCSDPPAGAAALS